MTTATATEEQTAELTPAQAEADEEAGFNSTIELPTGSETDTPVLEDVERPSPEPTAASEEVITEPEFKAARISEDAFQKLLSSATEIEQVKAAIEQRYNGLGGKIGGLERIVNEFKSGAGKKAEISRDDMKELLEEFPEFGERAITGLNRALAKVHVNGGSGLTPDQVEEIVVKREEAREIVRLDKRQKDWREIIGLKDPKTGQLPSTPYRQWLSTQEESYRTDIEGSTDADEIAESIKKFKEFTASKPNVPAQKPQLTDRERELRRAVQPRSAGGGSVAAGAQDEETAMAEAFKRELRRN